MCVFASLFLPCFCFCVCSVSFLFFVFVFRSLLPGCIVRSGVLVSYALGNESTELICMYVFCSGLPSVSIARSRYAAGRTRQGVNTRTHARDQSSSLFVDHSVLFLLPPLHSYAHSAIVALQSRRARVGCVVCRVAYGGFPYRQDNSAHYDQRALTRH